MTSYVAEPLPLQVDATLSEYLSRQFSAIQTNFMASMIVPEVRVMPSNAVLGTMVLLVEEDDEMQFAPGLYLYFRDVSKDTIDSQGEAAWMQVQMNPA